MDDMIGRELFFQPVINPFQIPVGAFIHPSTDVLHRNIDFLAFELLNDSVDRLRVDKLVVVYSCQQGRCCDTVPQKIRRSVRTDDRLFSFSGVDSYMMFDHLKACRMKLQAFINLIGKPFVFTIGECGQKFFIA